MSAYDHEFFATAEKRRAEARDRARDAQRERASEHWRQVVPAGFAHATWGFVLDADPAHDQPVVDAISRWADDPHGDLVLCGAPGTGKTFIACAVARRMVEERGLWPEFLAVPVMWHLLKSGGRDVLDRAIRAGVLVLDDLGAARGEMTDWQFGELQALLPTRDANRRPTIITSNMLPGELADYLGERMRSRLTTATIVEVYGPDRRRAAATA